MNTKYGSPANPIPVIILEHFDSNRCLVVVVLRHDNNIELVAEHSHIVYTTAPLEDRVRISRY